MKRFFISFLIFLIVAGSIAGVSGYYFMQRVIAGVPSVDFLRNYVPVTTSHIYDRNGQRIGSFYKERREYLPLTKIPPLIVHSVLAVEDVHFYNHGALAYGSIIRAAISDALAGYLREGASTITQQLARNIFLTHRKTFIRKLREAILSYRIERVLNKDEILELYLNQIYFGEGAYGVSAAAKTYFGKSLSELTLAETAMIAGMIRSPIEFSPFLHPEASKRRQLIVLERMERVHFISEEDKKKAYAAPIELLPPTHSASPSAYFLEYVRQKLELEMPAKKLFGGGLRIFTTLDLRVQLVAVQALRKGLRAIDRRQGFRGAIRKVPRPILAKLLREAKPDKDPQSGEDLRGQRQEVTILRVGKSFAWFSLKGHLGRISEENAKWAQKILKGPNIDRNKEILTPFSLGRILKPGYVVMAHILSQTREKSGWILEGALDQVPAVQGAVVALDPKSGGILAMVGGYSFKRSKFNRAVQALRQPGSVFKVIDYGAALEKGFAPGTILNDSPLVFLDRIHRRVWRPKDFEANFLGPVPMRKALAESINLATIRLVRKVGVVPVINFARRLGITTPLPHDLTLALGSATVRPIEITGAVSVIANGGIREQVHSIDRVFDYHKTTIYKYNPAPQAVYDPAYSYLLTSMMQSVIKEGTGREALSLGVLLAGKTGTTNNFRDAWFIGFSPSIVVGVYVGMDDHRSMGHGEFGAKAALPVWIDVMKGALPLYPPNQSFEIPDDIVDVRIDPDTGLRVPLTAQKFVVEEYKKGDLPPTESSAEGPIPEAGLYNLNGAP
ncbi:MAG: PBP1A family penicillin-binding protein [Nitrospirota bacterium]|nr:PBP1A family penicillin-binding protein [Nitrospirota bacterium]